MPIRKASVLSLSLAGRAVRDGGRRVGTDANPRPLARRPASNPRSSHPRLRPGGGAGTRAASRSGKAALWRLCPYRHRPGTRGQGRYRLSDWPMGGRQMYKIPAVAACA
jgi:hypothetical protein